jgi:hypothetical protein
MRAILTDFSDYNVTNQAAVIGSAALGAKMPLRLPFYRYQTRNAPGTKRGFTRP